MHCEKHKEAMSEDYKRNNQSIFVVEQMVLIDIRKLLESMQKDIKMYPLPDIDDTYDPSGDIPKEIFEEANVEASIDDIALSKTLNEEQQAVYNEIMYATIPIMGVCSLWMDLAAQERLIYTGLYSLL